jgi:hypothetical protein
MPQASDELRSEFHDDLAAFAALGDVGVNTFDSPRFGLKDFIFFPKSGVIPTAVEERAIQYLCDEWDYGYSSVNVE